MKRYNARFKLEIVANQLRREEFQGREHLVSPVVAVQEMIIPNTQEFLPAEEIELSVGFWEGVPVAIGHPQRNGQGVSAGLRDVQENEVIGQMFDVFFHAPSRSLRGELWIDLERAPEIDRGEELVDALETAEGEIPIEVSTAYFAKVEPETGTFGGVEFEGIQREIRPDHLAILLDQMGACSVAAGCGTPRINEEKMSKLVRSSARRPSFSGTEAVAWSAPTLTQWVDGWVRMTGATRPDSITVEALPSSAKRWISSRTLLGEATATEFRDLAFFPVVNPRTNKLNANALRAVLGGRGSQANIPAAARDSAQARARTLLESQFEEAARHPGDCPPGQHRGPTGRCVPNSRRNFVDKAIDYLKRALNSEDHSMDRKKTIEALKANKACPFSAARLEELEDDELTKLSETLEASGDKGGEPSAERTKAIEALKANKACPFSAERLDKFSDDELVKLAASYVEPAKPPEKGAPAPVALSKEDRELLEAVRKVGIDKLNSIAVSDAEKRKEIVARIKANKANEIPEKTLEAMDLVALESIDRMLSPASYAGIGYAYQTAGGEGGSGIPKAPAVMFRTQADAGDKEKGAEEKE